jgi:hypothetical protein
MCEGLWKVAEVTAGRRIDLFAVQVQFAGQRQEFLA